MAEELRDIWRSLRHNPDVNCAVLTAAGERAFCTGIDRSEVNVDWPDELASGTPGRSGGAKSGGGTIGFTSPFMLDDPGEYLGPKSNDLWKPVIAAVNGMACGGAFYMLGEVEFIIAAEHATFFDPHVTYGMTAAYEPIHMSGIMPFPEIMRLSLLGNHERMSAQRAHEIGMVTEVAPKDELLERAGWAASRIASQPALAIEGTVRALWGAREHGAREALKLGYAYVAMGTNPDSIAEGQKVFESGKRIEWKLR
jgi:enoyl-CoA hydratase/carnithine racemase